MKNPEAILKSKASPKKAALLMTFFKTGKGQYAEGDRFLGVMVPEIRQVAAAFSGLPLKEIENLLLSPYNEVRLLALIIMVDQYKRGDDKTKARIFRSYLKNLRRVNNWNLVDASAHYIAGDYLLEKDRAVLYKLSKSKDLWEKRVAIVSTWAFIRAKDYSDTLDLSSIFLKDNHDLMHKACGWMLREVGKKDVTALKKFLNENHAKMPRTMLRYAIERFPEGERKMYLKKG